MAKYRRKPVIVEVERFWPGVPPPVGVHLGNGKKGQPEAYLPKFGTVYPVFKGDYIVTDVYGEHHVMTPEAFERDYEIVL